MSKYETYVIVTRIESYSDPNRNVRGKKIEFSIIEKRIERNEYQQPEIKIVREMVNQLKSMGFVMPIQNIRNLKMILYLLPEEEEALGITFNVNNIYKLTFSNNGLMFTDVTKDFYLIQ